jgi:predicted AlkP superfamily phosphohydrolase/phosphomutase
LVEKPKILIISIDGGSWNVLEPLKKRGVIPHISKLMERGCHGILYSTNPPVTPPAWTSFMTGKNPGKHGIFDFRVYDPFTTSDYFSSYSRIQSATIWEILNERGKKVGVINLPLTYPPHPIESFIVSGFDTPSVQSSFTFPEDLKLKILEKFPEYDFLHSWGEGALNSLDALRSFIKKSCASLEEKAQLGLYLWERYPFDLFHLHFQETDIIQHRLWSLFNFSELSGEDLLMQNMILEFYKKLDEMTGLFLEKAEEIHATKIILSDHGFQSHRGVIYPNHLLREKGFLWIKQNQEEEDKGKSYFLPRSWKFLKRMVKAIKPPSQTQPRPARTRNWMERERETDLMKELPIEWSKTSACVVSAELYGFIYFNVKGREPCGLVNPGREYDSLKRELTDLFCQIESPVEGGRLIKKVIPGDELYQNGEGIVLPDLVLIPEDGFSISRSLSSEGLVKMFSPPIGTHSPAGIFIMEGKGIRQGTVDTARIIDLAPTILHLFDLPVPDDMDGKVLLSCLHEPGEVRFVAGKGRVERAGKGDLPREDSELIRERLKGLGYLG